MSAGRRSLCAAVALALGAACGPTGGDTGDGSAAAPWSVAALGAPGPHGVGYAVQEVVYTEPLGGSARRLRLAAWYPSTAGTSGAEIRYNGAFLRSGAVAGAPVAPGAFPLVLYSHGHQGFAEASSFLAHHLASHGHVVLAPDHTGNTLADGPRRTTEIYAWRPLDLRAVLDAAPGLGLPIDAAAPVVAFGHSFGGYTLHAAAGATHDLAALGPACAAGTGPADFCSTWSPALEAAFAAGFDEPRIAAVASMAPGDFALFGAGLGTLQRPFLLLLGAEDPGQDGGPIWDALEATPRTRVDLAGGGHNVFTDFSGALDGGGDALIDPARGFAIVNTYAHAFVRRHARGDAAMDAILDGRTAVDPAATLTTP
jgi:predicted dienelactone hydrolase